MVRDKKYTVDNITTLRRILDNPADCATLQMLAPGDADLRSLCQRLTSGLSPPQRFDIFSRRNGSLEPRVTIHPKASATPLVSRELPEFQVVSTPFTVLAVSTSLSALSDEELYEVEKVEAVHPEFLEIVSRQPQVAETLAGSTEPVVVDKTLPQWQPVDEPITFEPMPQRQQELPPVSAVPEFQILDSSRRAGPVTLPEAQPPSVQEPLVSTPAEVQPVEQLESPQFRRKRLRAEKKQAKQQVKEARRQKKLELKKIKRETREKEKEAEHLVRQQQTHKFTAMKEPQTPEAVSTHEQLPMTAASSAFQGIKSIDAATAELLCNNGYFSLENLRDATVDDLVRIRGIKRNLAKKIKQELRQNMPPSSEPEFIPLKKKFKVLPHKKQLEDAAEWETYDHDASGTTQSLPFIYRSYTLYKREIRRPGGKKTDMYFFSKEHLKKATPSPLPDGYRIAVNKKTKVPYLKKKT